MDIVHHAAIGGLGGLAAYAVDQPIAGWTFLLGSVFPDTDATFEVIGKRFFLNNHQAITHSLPLSPIYAMIICGFVFYLLEEGWDWWAYGAALSGIWLHLGLDLLNTFRIALFSPFSRKRYSLDAVFFIDAGAWAVTGFFYLAYFYYHIGIMLYMYPVLIGAYALFKVKLRNRVIKTLKPLHAIPSAINPFQFYVLTQSGSSLCGYLYNVITGEVRDRWVLQMADERYALLAEQSPVFRDLRQICRAFHIVGVTEDKEGTVIYAADLAVRNFGGYFGRTELKFDTKGRLVHEMAHI